MLAGRFDQLLSFLPGLVDPQQAGIDRTERRHRPAEVTGVLDLHLVEKIRQPAATTAAREDS